MRIILDSVPSYIVRASFVCREYIVPMARSPSQLQVVYDF